MEFVAWVLLNKYDCTLKGGFVRDWVVGGRENFPTGVKLQVNPVNGKEDILDERVSPKDLDVTLPIFSSKKKHYKVFVPDEFIRIMKSYSIDTEVDESEGWRYYCIFDRNRPSGAFTADII